MSTISSLVMVSISSAAVSSSSASSYLRHSQLYQNGSLLSKQEPTNLPASNATSAAALQLATVLFLTGVCSKFIGTRGIGKATLSLICLAMVRKTCSTLEPLFEEVSIN